MRKLGKVEGTRVMVKPMGRSVARLQRRMQEYPPALSPMQGPASQPVRFAARGRPVEFIARRRKPYRRTGTYGRRWTIRITAGNRGVMGRVGNNTRYAPYVGSQQFQARIHRGRWNTDRRVVGQEQVAILADFRSEIDRALAE